jgi:hypothetical protein
MYKEGAIDNVGSMKSLERSGGLCSAANVFDASLLLYGRY